jgi:hypothetical protein
VDEQRFKGAAFVRKPWYRPKPTWDHDHCVFCWVRFAEAGSPQAAADPDAVTEGYATAGPPRDPRPDYYWVCQTCFDDFRDRLDFKLAAEG